VLELKQFAAVYLNCKMFAIVSCSIMTVLVVMRILFV